MRIEAYSQINQIYNTDKTKSVSGTSRTTENDKLEISQKGRNFHIAKAAVAESEDIREDLVAEYKSKIQSGTYEVSSEDFANKILDKYNDLFF